MKKLLALLTLLPALAFGQGPAMRATNGVAAGPTLIGPVNATNGLAIGAPNNAAQAEQQLRTFWHQHPVGNRGSGNGGYTEETYRNATANYQAYGHWGGSGAALTDLPARGPDIWSHMPKPYIILSTRDVGTGNNLVNCTIGNVTNAVRGWTTNFYNAFFSNVNVGQIAMLENGWLTNHRAANGLLRWDTNRFNWFANSDTLGATNLAHWLNTNRFEMGLVMYSINYVPSPTNWSSSTISELGIDPVNNGATYWEFPGQANPFGANESQPAITPDSMHRDISSFYANGVRHLVLQETAEMSGIGPFDQLVRQASSAAMSPYFNPGQSSQIPLDGNWSRWYPSVGTATGTAPHGMSIGIMMGNLSGPWPQRFANDVNHLFVESNGGSPQVAGSLAIGWLMSQVNVQALYLSNAYGGCLFSPSTDGFNPGGNAYKDWKGLFGGLAVLTANRWFTGAGANAYNYFTTAGFGLTLTNINVVDAWQEVTYRPPIICRMDTTNQIIAKEMRDGSKLVWLANAGGTATNLTVTWRQLGIPTNIVCPVTEVWTNENIGTFTNSITLAVPAVDSFLIRVHVPPTLYTGTNIMSMIYDRSTAVGSIRLNNTNMIQMFPAGRVAVNAAVNLAAGVTLGKGGGSHSIALESDGSYYFVVRDGSSGFLNLMGEQSQLVTALALRAGSGSSNVAHFGAGGIAMHTNSRSQWPTAALTEGGFYIANSNGGVYILTSTPGSRTWAATNKIAGP